MLILELERSIFMLGKFRQTYEKVMMPVGRVLGKTGITPNMITVFSLIMAAVTAYIFYIGDLLLGTLFIVLTAFVDMLDGAIARATGKASKFGAVFDHTLDRYAEWFFYLGLMLGGFLPWLWGYFTLFAMIMASFTRAKAESVGGLEKCTVGIAERQEKLILLIAGILLTYYYPASWMAVLSYFPVSVQNFFVSLNIVSPLTLLVVIAGVLSHITVIQRLNYTKKNAR